MNWIEEVRAALRNTIRRWEESKEWHNKLPLNPIAMWGPFGNCAGEAKKALAAIPDEPEMVKLLGWLKEQQTSMAMHYLDGGGVMEIIVGHIEEMGYKLEDE